MRAIRHALATIALVGLVGALAHAETELFFGDTHLHTSWSPDAYLLQNRSADPDTAYRYAKGQPVVHPYHRARIRIETPLDFLVVSDHAEYMGVIPMILKNDPRVAGSATAKQFQKLVAEGKEREAFGILIGQVNEGVADPALVSEEITSSVWQQIMAAAERHNDPGTFTTFLGWEWTSTPDGANLHRVVLFKEGEAVGQKFLPYTSLERVGRISGLSEVRQGVD